jgi:hypothetical protein
MKTVIRILLVVVLVFAIASFEVISEEYWDTTPPLLLKWGVFFFGVWLIFRDRTPKESK